MSSRSSQKAMRCWPRPMVYFPWDVPSNCSSSDCSTNRGLGGVREREVLGLGSRFPLRGCRHCRDERRTWLIDVVQTLFESPTKIKLQLELQAVLLKVERR